MATSTEDSIRAALVDAIQAIAQSDLGFDDVAGNIKDYLLEYQPEELKSQYLMARVNGRKQVRAWAVQVKGNDDWYAAGNITKRRYTITIEAYYSIGTEGAGINAMIAGARKVRNAIRGLNSTLGNRVDIVASTGEIDTSLITGLDAEGEILLGRMVYTAEKVNPDF